VRWVQVTSWPKSPGRGMRCRRPYRTLAMDRAPSIGELAECVTSSISAMGPTKTKHPVVQMAVEAACNVDILTK